MRLAPSRYRTLARGFGPLRLPGVPCNRNMGTSPSPRLSTATLRCPPATEISSVTTASHDLRGLPRGRAADRSDTIRGDDAFARYPPSNRNLTRETVPGQL